MSQYTCESKRTTLHVRLEVTSVLRNSWKMRSCSEDAASVTDWAGTGATALQLDTCRGIGKE